MGIRDQKQSSANLPAPSSTARLVAASGVPLSEKQLQRNVEELATVLGWMCAHFRPAMTDRGWRTPVSGQGKGFPDLCLAHPEHGVVFAELKAAKGKLRSEQEHWRGVLERGGARVFVWRPDDWVEGRILAVLKGD